MKLEMDTSFFHFVRLSFVNNPFRSLIFIIFKNSIHSQNYRLFSIDFVRFLTE